jgi:hypothetical protein
MDQEESWYVSNTTVKRIASNLTISESSSTLLKTGSYSLAKQSENVVKVNKGEFYLYRKAGANGTLSGKIGMGGGGAASLRAWRHGNIVHHPHYQ